MQLAFPCGDGTEDLDNTTALGFCVNRLALCEPVLWRRLQRLQERRSPVTVYSTPGEIGEELPECVVLYGSRGRLEQPDWLGGVKPNRRR